MKKTIIQKQFNNVRWTTEHTLTPDQLKQLIQNKFERARKNAQNQTTSKKRLFET